MAARDHRLPVLQVEVFPTSEAPAQARQALSALEGVVGPEVLDDLNLLVSELVSNAVRHAHLLPDESIWIRVSITHRLVTVEVSDPGHQPWFQDPEQFLASVGFGLTLCDRIADRGGAYWDGGSHVWFELSLDDATLR